jgi:holliday junction DNA helicase RuvA
MIAYLHGTVTHINPDYLLVDVHGVGYRVYFNRPENVHLNQPVMLFTHHYIREDASELFGFLDSKELDLFERLISVKGLGVKTAQGMLTYSTYDRLVLAIEQADVSALKAMPGIGAKTASQVILDLKGKLVHVANKETTATNDQIKDAFEGLKALGYKAAELSSIQSDLIKHPEMDASAIMKLALQLLAVKRGK